MTRATDFNPLDAMSKYQKKGGKKKPYGIEMYLDTSYLPKCVEERFKSRWFPHKWYDTEAKRDQALITLNKSVCTVLRGKERYRKVDR